MSIVNCSGCGAELSDDRANCPHCGESIVPALEALAQGTTDSAVKELVARIVEHERHHAHDREQIEYLTAECERLRSENKQLREPAGRQQNEGV